MSKDEKENKPIQKEKFEPSKEGFLSALKKHIQNRSDKDTVRICRK